MKKTKHFAIILLCIAYAPVYLLAWFLHILSRFLLALSYFGLLEHRMGRAVIASLFKYR